MEDTQTTTVHPLFSPAVENPVEKIVREAWLAVVRAAPEVPEGPTFGAPFMLGPNEHDVARAITKALANAGHLKEPHPTCTSPDIYGKCTECGGDMIDQLRKLPDLTPGMRDLIEDMANREPEPAPLERRIGRHAFRRVASLRAMRKALGDALERNPNPRHTDRAALAALTFAIDVIQTTYKDTRK